MGTGTPLVPHPFSGKIFFPIVDNGQGSVKGNFTMCIVPAFVGRKVHITRASDSLPSRARNIATASFLQTDCTHLLFIDGDIIFEKEHIDMLLEHDQAIVCGIYCKRQVKIEPVLCTFKDHVEDPDAVLIKVARAGTGFMLIRRDVFEAMRDNPPEKYPCPKYTNHKRDEWDFWSVGVVGGEYLSEDWYFCDRAREMGYDIFVDQRIQVRHEGDCIFPIEVK